MLPRGHVTRFNYPKSHSLALNARFPLSRSTNGKISLLPDSKSDERGVSKLPQVAPSGHVTDLTTLRCLTYLQVTLNLSQPIYCWMISSVIEPESLRRSTSSSSQEASRGHLTRQRSLNTFDPTHSLVLYLINPTNDSPAANSGSVKEKFSWPRDVATIWNPGSSYQVTYPKPEHDNTRTILRNVIALNLSVQWC